MRERKPVNLDRPETWPDAPRLWDMKRYREELVPELIRIGGIPKSSLIPGKSYLGTCRNSEKAVWDGKEFEYIRTKFGSSYPERIPHFEDDPGNGSDVFLPFKEI